MKRLKVLICGLAITLPAMLMIYFDQPTGTAKAESEKAVQEREDEGGEARETADKNEYTAPTSWIGAFRTGPQEEITNSIGMRLRLIPAGSFMMGAVPGDDEAEDDEKPRHRVEISKPFHIGVYEVTQAQYESVMGTNPSYVKGSRRPVEQVSWNDAVEFCRKLSQREGVTYRLPTEAEWEYAARGGMEGKLNVWGDENTPVVNGVKQANVADESAKRKYSDWTIFEGYDDGYAESSPAGSFAPNGFGLYDMGGNVWEWCADWYDRDYYSRSPSKDPVGPSSGNDRVLRGGCWKSNAGWMRSSNRADWDPDIRSYNGGFRLVRDVE